MKRLLIMGLQLSTLITAPAAFSTAATAGDVLSEAHTIDTLSKLSDEELFTLVRYKGINESCIPEGVSAGKPGRIDKNVITNDNAFKVIFRHIFHFLGRRSSQQVADIIWKGKTFHRSEENCAEGWGTNRVGLINLFSLKAKTLTRETFIGDEGRMNDASESGFVNALAANPNDTNLVELNYSRPRLDPMGMGRAFGIRDIMVPIPGKNGTIYIGRAYTGKWTSTTSFKSSGMVAWFFLDFSDEAVRNDSWYGRIFHHRH
jgi:hypothetical protein